MLGTVRMSDSDVDPEEDSSCASDEGGSVSRDQIRDALGVPSVRREVDDRASDCGARVDESGAARLAGEAALPNDRLDRRSRDTSGARTDRDADRTDAAGDAPSAPAGACTSSWPERCEEAWDGSDTEASLSLGSRSDGTLCETSGGSGTAAVPATRRRSDASAETDALGGSADRDCDADLTGSGAVGSGDGAERTTSAGGADFGECVESSVRSVRGVSVVGTVLCASPSCVSAGFAAENTGCPDGESGGVVRDAIEASERDVDARRFWISVGEALAVCDVGDSSTESSDAELLSSSSS